MNPCLDDLHDGSRRPDGFSGLLPQGLGHHVVRGSPAGIAELVGDLFVGQSGCLELNDLHPAGGGGAGPSALALLSTPPIAAAAVRVAKFVGRGLLRVGSAAWTGLKGILGLCGNTGTQVVEVLSQAGATVAGAFRAAAQHPVMAPVTRALRACAALVRPVSWGFVTHRLLGALVPILWVRAVVELLVMPFLVDSTLAGNVRDSVWTPCTDQADSDVTSDGLLIDVLATPMPKSTNGSAAGADQFDDEEPPLNRASRRAQQREEAQARRPQHPRR